MKNLILKADFIISINKAKPKKNTVTKIQIERIFYDKNSNSKNILSWNA